MIPAADRPLILLPPSEAKADGGVGPPVRPGTLLAPELDGLRRQVRRAVIGVSRGDPAAAARALLLPGRVAPAALRRNTELVSGATMPALQRYTGVLYRQLAAAADGVTVGAAGPTDAPAAVLARNIWIFSGLWGVVAGEDLIPAYRVPAAALLPGLGALRRLWRPALAAALPTLVADRVIVDLRSSDYAALWRAESAAGVVTVQVRGLRLRGGVRVPAPATTAGKQLKGLLLGALLGAPAPRAPQGAAPSSAVADQLAALAEQAGANAAARSQAGGVQLTLTVPEAWRPA